MPFLRGAFYGSVAGVAAFLAMLWVMWYLPIPFDFTCTREVCDSLSFDITYLAVPVLFLWLGVTVAVYDLLSRRPLFSSTVDGLLIGLGGVLNLLAFPALLELTILVPPI
jgi:hypothetical protein